MSRYHLNVVKALADINANFTGSTYVAPKRTKAVIVRAKVTGAVTGTNPTLTLKLQASLDGTTWYSAAVATAFAAANDECRLVVDKLAEERYRVIGVIGGTGSPTFNDVNCDLLFVQDEHSL